MMYGIASRSTSQTITATGMNSTTEAISATPVAACVSRARTMSRFHVALIASVVLFLPVAVIVWDVEREAIPYIIASGLLELTYIALLAAAYERVPLSIVYPVARGTAPVLVLVLGALLLGIHPSGGQVVGILVVAAGVMIVRGIGRDVSAGQLILPLAVAVTIASYTLVDRSGIQHAGAIPYFELTALITLAYPMWIARRRGVGAVSYTHLTLPTN